MTRSIAIRRRRNGRSYATPSVVHPRTIYTKPVHTKNPNSGMGTSFADIPTLLAQYKVDAVITNKTTPPKTPSSAAGGEASSQPGTGHKVILSVDAELIRHRPVATKDENGNPRSDHALVVTGVDTARVVHLNDSDDPTGRYSQIPMALFVKAWDTGDEPMVVST